MKYSKERTEKFCNAIEGLKGRVSACKEAGIGYDAFLEWLKKYPEFTEAVKKAEAKAEGEGRERAIQAIFKAMDTQWTAGAWWLERKFPDEFGNRQRIDHGGSLNVEGNVKTTIEISDKSLKAIGDAIAGATASVKP